MHNQFSIILAFAIYLGLMMYIGIYYYRKSRNLSDYILGGRKLGPWITSMSAEASDMSGWMLMGLPGFAYSTGISAIWIAIGLAGGTGLNWAFVSKRLRNHTEVANNSLTIPDYLKNRFRDTSRILPIVSAIFIIIFFLIYTSSGFVAGGKLFTTIFGLDYHISLLITAGVVIFYTFLGGFLAVSWTDFIQGTMMFFAILLIPTAAAFTMNGPVNTAHLIATEFPQGLSIWGPEADTYTLVIGIISSVAWGLGYFGQPHILVRFMAISDARELKKATNIAMVWVVISLVAAVMVGLVGKVFLSTPLTGADVEKVFLVMNEKLFPPFIAGLVWSAVLAAIMSTASGQLLVTASSVSQDLYKNIVGHRTSDQELVLISRLTVLVISAIAFLETIRLVRYLRNRTGLPLLPHRHLCGKSFR